MNKYSTIGIPTATVDNLSWLAGNWCGDEEDIHFDEQWTTPSSHTMMGMFRWIQNDQVRFYEFMTIEQEAHGVVLRIKHFNPGLIGWEEKEVSVAFTLVQISEEQAVFVKQDAADPLWLIYRKVDENSLMASFESEGDAAKSSEGVFHFTRQSL